MVNATETGETDMKNLGKENNGVFEIEPTGLDELGSTIAKAMVEATRRSTTRTTAVVKFSFNDVVVNVVPDSDPELIIRDYHRALSGYIDKNVGPNPKPVLSNKEKANDARIKAENDRRHKQEHAEYEAKATANREAVEAKLTGAPGMEPLDEDLWQSLKDANPQEMGQEEALAYAERWARLMQMEMANGKKLEDVADITSYEADFDNISGSMYQFALSALIGYWRYGHGLRRWGSIKRQV